jgi:hypothetical protein
MVYYLCDLRFQCRSILQDQDLDKILGLQNINHFGLGLSTHAIRVQLF